MESHEKDMQGTAGIIQVGGMEYCLWLDSIGKGRTWGWKARKLKRVEVVNIDECLFITQTEINRFWARARAGEFAKQLRMCSRN